MCFYTFLHLLPPHPKTSKKNALKLHIHHQSLTTKWKERPLDPPATHCKKHSSGVLSTALAAAEVTLCETRATHQVRSVNTDTLELRLTLTQSHDHVEWVSPPVTGTLESASH